MKAPAFWYAKPGVVSALLSPLGCIYGLGGKIRRAQAKPYQAKVPVICVGNVVAGGAGKTPLVLAVAQFLRQMNQRPAFVSRGYGGTETGPLRIDPAFHFSGQVGDEPLLLAQQAPTWIGRDKAAVVAAVTDATHIILDDGLQNPHVKHDLALLTVDGERGLGNGHVIPAGPLRETFDEALQRSHAVVLVGEDKHGVERLVAGRRPVLKAKLVPQLPDGFNRAGNFFAFAGIGNPEKFFATCRAAGLHLTGWQALPDHYPYSISDWQQLAQQAGQQRAWMITTAKDAVRLAPEWREDVIVMKVELVFEDDVPLLQLLRDL